MSKLNAKDYLLEYKAKGNTPNWLGLLIQNAVDSNGQIFEADKKNIFAKLLEENKLDIISTNELTANISDNLIDLTDKQSTNNQQKLVLKKITHIKGVNALIPNQSINFSPSCTVVYGLNGTGKSGYFRIIHELTGGKKQKSVLCNIRSQNDELEVDIDFSLDGNQQNQYKWQDRYKRGVLPFNQMAVFDSEYLPILLNERESSANIVPLGLHLFQVITSVIDDFKQQLEEKQSEYETSVPELQPLREIIHSMGIKSLLQKKLLIDCENKLMSENTSITADELSKLKELQQQKRDLEKQNIEDSEKLLEQEKMEIQLLINHLVELKQSLEDITIKVPTAIESYIVNKKARDDRAKQFEVIKNVPSQDSEEWQTFIESAEKYGIAINPDNFNKTNTCIYCHQPLNDDALKLIKAYSDYLSDKSQENFKRTVDTILSLTESLKDLPIEFNMSKELVTLLLEKKLKEQQDLKKAVNQIFNEVNKHKSTLLETLKNKKSTNKTYSIDLSKINPALLELIKLKQDKLDSLRQSDTKKVEAVTKINEQIEKLEDKQHISSWKVKIEKYFTINTKIQKYETVNDTITTTGITVLGSKAHDELLTESIRKSFEDELKALGKDVDVSLEKTGAGKGTVRTCIKILGSDVQDILSDGEQKAACLALFLGEAMSQQVGNPIVFDDPVTSVDHEVADLFAKRLLQISSDRQIIVFTHNRLFYDSLVYWGSNLKDEQDNKTHHVCGNYTQNGCNAKGFHIYTYTVDRESRDRVGKIFERQNESSKYFIDRAEKELGGSYTVSTIAGYLKSAIEYYIDEKMLNNQCLLKDRRRKENIPWKKLDSISVNKDILVKLKIHWDNLSDRGTHLTENSTQNPLKSEDFTEIIKFLKE